jgi:hypothetical protein
MDFVVVDRLFENGPNRQGLLKEIPWLKKSLRSAGS